MATISKQANIYVKREHEIALGAQGESRTPLSDGTELDYDKCKQDILAESIFREEYRKEEEKGGTCERKIKSNIF
jgi:hypothetical protein